MSEIRSARTVLYDTITEMAQQWQDGMPSELAVRKRLAEVLTLEVLGIPDGILPDSIDEIRQSMIDEAVAMYRLMCTVAADQ